MKITYHCEYCQNTFNNRKECLRHEIMHRLPKNYPDILKAIKETCQACEDCVTDDGEPICPLYSADNECCILGTDRQNPKDWFDYED